jgi:multidrug resistance efflux pump
MVRAGDLVVEFDRQDQLKNALDRRVELNDLEQQIRKKQAEGNAARARDDSELMQAQSSLGRAQLEILKNEMLPKIQAEKNTQALEEAHAKVRQLKTTYDLKRAAADADLRILQIRRDRAENAMRQAESNADRMAIKSPIGGMAVLRSIWKSNNMAEVQEGEEVRSGMPIVDVVNPASMRVRAKVNQADIGVLKPGLPVRIGLDAYPDLSFTGRVSQISPLAVTSALSPKVRNFIALIAVDGAHPNLMPDLTASLDVEIERQPRALIVPRDALRFDGEQVLVRVRKGNDVADQTVTVGSMNAHEAVITSGLTDGAVIERNRAATARSPR